MPGRPFKVTMVITLEESFEHLPEAIKRVREIQLNSREGEATIEELRVGEEGETRKELSSSRWKNDDLTCLTGKAILEQERSRNLKEVVPQTSMPEGVKSMTKILPPKEAPAKTKNLVYNEPFHLDDTKYPVHVSMTKSWWDGNRKVVKIEGTQHGVRLLDVFRTLEPDLKPYFIVEVVKVDGKVERFTPGTIRKILHTAKTLKVNGRV